MSRLNDLITELCPEGVEYKSLGEIAKVENGRNKDRHCEKAYSITQRGLIPTSEYFGDTKITSDDTSGYKIVKKGWFVYSPSRIDVGSINYLRDAEEVIVSPLNVVFSIDKEKICQDYLYSFLNSRSGTWQILTKREGIEGTGRKLLPFERFATIELPVPPLLIQYEIVRILNIFTEHIAELTAELTARKKQYEYYRDSVLSFSDMMKEDNNESVDWMPLIEVANQFRGEYITKKGTTEGSIPVILGGQEPAYYIDKANHIGEIVVVARSGASAGFVSYWNEPIFITDGFGYEAKKEKAIPKYLYYILKNMESELNGMKRGAGVPHVSGEMLGKIMIPVPSLNEQKRIVSILDRFDSLCNEISIGLPAEIAARQKQYEYYRDKLLTFKKLA